MATANQIRLSPDVVAIAQRLSDERGLGSQRVVVEAIVRTCWQHWATGSCFGGDTPLPLQPQAAAPQLPETNGADALGALGF